MRKKSWIALLVLAADRVTKLLSARLPAEGLVLIPGVVGLRYARNTGMAFSLFSGRPWLLGALSLLIILAAAVALRRFRPARPPAAGLMLMLGGAVGNMLDRFFTGYVPDMVELLFVNFAIFNVADACLTVGCALVMVWLLRREREGGKADG